MIHQAKSNPQLLDEQIFSERIASAISAIGRLCSLIPGLGVKLSNDILAGPTVLSAVGVSPPHDGVR